MTTSRRPTANVNDDEAGIDNDEVAGGGRRRPTTATTVADAADFDDDEATNGEHSCPMADTHDNEASSSGRCWPSKAPLAS